MLWNVCKLNYSTLQKKKKKKKKQTNSSCKIKLTKLNESNRLNVTGFLEWFEKPAKPFSE